MTHMTDQLLFDGSELILFFLHESLQKVFITAASLTIIKTQGTYSN